MPPRRTNGHANGAATTPDRPEESPPHEWEVAMREAEGERDAAMELLRERLIELEQQTEGWQELGSLGMGGVDGASEFSRGFLAQIIRLARLYWLKNPLIKRSVNVKASYVFGQGVNIHARHPEVNNAIQTFLDDPDNRAELFGQQAMLMKEVDLECEGNQFFALFVDKASGRLRLRTIPTDEIRDVVRNPEDRREVWYYQRIFSTNAFTPELGVQPARTMTAFYPDWRYKPAGGNKPSTIANFPVHWETPVYHMKINSFSSWKFGVPEVYAALDWARAYKEELEDDATRSRALARFVFQLSTKGGPTAVQRAKSRLNSTFATSGTQIETNPPPVAGSTFISTDGVDLKAVNIAGAMLPTDHSRPHRLMVASAVGLPDTILAGDPDQGNLATATTLDRPTELEMTNRRSLWRDVFLDILNFRIDQCALAPEGPLEGAVTKDADGREYIELAEDPDTGEPMDRHIDVDFPSILEHSVTESVAAIVEAATLNSTAGKLSGTIPAKTVSRLLMVALGVAEVDEALEELFPDEGEPEADVMALPQPPLTPQEQATADAAKAVADAKAEALKNPPPAPAAPVVPGQVPPENVGAPDATPARKETGVQGQATGGPQGGGTQAGPARRRGGRRQIGAAESALLEAIQELRSVVSGAMVADAVVEGLFESEQTSDDEVEKAEV